MQHIDLMSRIDISYTACHMETQNLAHALTGFQGLKRFIKHLSSHPNNPIFILIILMMAQISLGLHGVGIKGKTEQPRIVYNAINIRIVL